MLLLPFNLGLRNFIRILYTTQVLSLAFQRMILLQMASLLLVSYRDITKPWETSYPQLEAVQAYAVWPAAE